MSKELSTNIYEPSTFEEANKLALTLSESSIVPADFRNQPGNVLIAMQMGHDVGLSPTQALQSIAVINGRPSIWGDAIPAIIKNHPAYEWMKETYDEEKYIATCEMKRKGEKTTTIQSFSWNDAVVAGLVDKKGSLYKKYPKRMLQMRARSWAARDCFPDALKGLSVAEEMQDAELIDMGDADVVSGPAVQETKPSDIKKSVEKVVDPDLQKGKVELDDEPKTHEDVPASTKEFLEELDASDDVKPDDDIVDAEITEVEPAKEREPGEDDDKEPVTVAPDATDASVVATQTAATETKPEPKPAESKVLKPHMVKMVMDFLKKYNIDEKDLLKQYKVDSVGAIPVGEASAVLKWIQTQAN